ncbi:MAG TPA: MFS transporter [Nocardioides sp.]|uniref:MFS transporter n=1 Tax=Nocardioides sp. TaxID=35761 RepID=UPI002E2FF6F7|nr:MFS transporter [Nocardioides sp.]HEX5089985.1 MFS transporter [Nocardioides sp.]
MRTDARTGSHRWAMWVLLATQLMVILDGTIVNVALPTIRDDLGFSDAGLAWVVNGFFVPFALLLLPSGRLGDLVGSRRVFVTGLVVFTAATAAAGLATGPAVLVVARVAQGVGGALTSAVVLGMIAALYDDARARARAFALVAFVGSAGASIGVLSGGLLTDLASWRWVFWVNVPIGLAVLFAAHAVLDETPDVPGLRRGLSRSRALVPRSLVSDRAFLLPNLVLFTMTVAGFSFQFLTALYLQDSLGLDALRTGLAYLPVTLAIAVSSLGVSARLAARFGQEQVMVAGLVLFMAGMLLMAALPDHGSFAVHVVPGFVVMGAGFGLAMPQVTALAMAAAPSRDAGAASGFVNTTQQAGGVVGLAVVATVAAGEGRAAGFLLAAGALVLGALVAVYLAGAAAGRRCPVAGPHPAGRVATHTLEGC